MALHANRACFYKAQKQIENYYVYKVFCFMFFQSLLINGRGRFNCSLLGSSSSVNEVCKATDSECSPYVLTVEPGKTYRLRIGSLTSLSSLSFQIEVL